MIDYVTIELLRKYLEGSGWVIQRKIGEMMHVWMNHDYSDCVTLITLKSSRADGDVFIRHAIEKIALLENRGVKDVAKDIVESVNADYLKPISIKDILPRYDEGKRLAYELVSDGLAVVEIPITDESKDIHYSSYYWLRLTLNNSGSDILQCEIVGKKDVHDPNSCIFMECPVWRVDVNMSEHIKSVYFFEKYRSDIIRGYVQPKMLHDEMKLFLFFIKNQYDNV